MPKLAFWTWLLLGLGTKKAGVRKLLDGWIFLHFAIAIVLVCLLDTTNFSDVAKSIVLPASGILLGMTFAWSGNITALLGTNELAELFEFHSGKISEYVYTVQLSILIVFFACILWVFAAFGLCGSFIGKFFLFVTSSIAVRECWQTIMFAQYMTICRDIISKRNTTKNHQ